MHTVVRCPAACAPTSATALVVVAFLFVFASGSAAWAQNQSGELAGLTPVDAKTLEAIDSSGNQTYAVSSPILYEGILLNTPSQMSSVTPDYNDENEGGPTPQNDIGNLNPYWQVFVQSTQTGDHGGVAAFIGQNYGNIPDDGSGNGATFPGGVFTPNTNNDYSDAAWQSQVLRLNTYNNDQNVISGFSLSAGQQLQAGDEVIIYARAGGPFGGKFNINEQHSITPDYATDPGLSFDVFYAGHPGLPAPVSLTLSGLYNGGTSVAFDSTGATGAEFYQGDWATISGIKLANPNDPNWVPNGVVTVEDAAGRTFSMQLGNSVFADKPTGFFNATGIFDQESGQGSPTGGYELWVMNPSDIVPTPEPSTLLMAASAMAGLVAWKLRLRRREAE
jgi:hypothetical protein